jgi:RNA polymerase sigma factor (sigma-70 family)
VGNKIDLAPVFMKEPPRDGPRAEGGRRLQASDKRTRFERAVLPHLEAAYNLARWLTRNDQDADDVVQEACVRALTFFDSFRGEDGRSWLLAVVRNTCYTWLEKHRAQQPTIPLDENVHGSSSSLNPEELFLRQAASEVLRAAVADLPLEFREVVVLREMEDLSYKEIAAVLGIPLGTVMSRLTRGRARLQQCLSARKEFGT